MKCCVFRALTVFGIVSALAFAQSPTDKLKNLENQLLRPKAPSAPEIISSPEESADSDEVELLEPESVQVRAKDLEAVEDAVSGPRAIPREHIFVVQRQYVRKQGRHEVVPLNFGIQPADSFRIQLQWSASYIYHFTESLALEALNLNFFTNYPTNLQRTLLNSVNFLPIRAEPVVSLGSSIQWTPFQAKTATDESVYHFEGYLLAGGGITSYEDSKYSMATWGLGYRIYLSRSTILKAEIRDFMDFRSGVSHRMNVALAAGILLGGPRED